MSLTVKRVKDARSSPSTENKEAGRASRRPAVPNVFLTTTMFGMKGNSGAFRRIYGLDSNVVLEIIILATCYSQILHEIDWSPHSVDF